MAECLALKCYAHFVHCPHGGKFPDLLCVARKANDVECSDDVKLYCVYPMTTLDLGDTDCTCTGRNLPSGEPCTGAEDEQCRSPLVCGRFSSNSQAYQCCNCNNCTISGEAWCQNEEGEACSDGKNDNCQDDLVCGLTYSQDGQESYECCEYSESFAGDGRVKCPEPPSPPAPPPLLPPAQQ